MLLKRFLPLVLAGLVLGASPARAFDLTLFNKPLRLDLTENLQAHVRPWDPGNSDASSAYYHDIASRLNVQATWNHFVLSVRLDSTAYLNTPVVGTRLANAECPAGPTAPPSCTVQANNLQNRFHTALFDPRKFFEKTSLSWSNDNFDVTLGDAYVNLGRGLVLSLRKIDQLSVDTTLLGGKVQVKAGDFSATALAGWTNIQNVDDIFARYIPDPYDFITGGRADYKIAGKVSVGVEGVWGMQPNGSITSQTDNHTRVGVVVDAPRPLPWLSFYGEYAQAYRHITTTEKGSALYLSSTVFAGPTSWLLEFKWYQNFQNWAPSSTLPNAIFYAAPPNLERVLVQVLDNTDIIAGRLKTDVYIAPWLSFYVSPEVGAVYPIPGQQDLLGDVYVGGEIRWGEGASHAFPLVEWRREWGPNLTGTVESFVAFELDAAQALAKSWSLELQSKLWLRERPAENTGGWQEADAYLSLKWTPRLQAALGWETTTASLYQAQQHDFVNGSVQWNITPANSVALFVGGRRPGLRCISGVCRNFPPFQGIELSFVARG